jgi:HSP20 family molecular chaperone IbpA
MKSKFEELMKDIIMLDSNMNNIKLPSNMKEQYDEMVDSYETSEFKSVFDKIIEDLSSKDDVKESEELEVYVPKTYRDYDIIDTEDKSSTLFVLSVPGYTMYDIMITYEDSLIVVSGIDKNVKSDMIISRQITFDAFKNTFKMLRAVESIECSLEKGLLQIKAIYEKPIIKTPIIKYV